MLASTASDRKGAKNSSWYFMILPKNNCFQNIKIKLNSTTWMTLMSSLVIFQALEPLQPQWPLQPPWPQWPIQPHFIKKITDIDDWIIPSTTMTNTYCGIDIRKSHFTVISGTLSVGGCWGQPMLFFLKLVDETQMPKPPEPPRHYNSRKPLRAI